MKTQTEKQDYEIAREELEALYARTCPQGQVVRVGTATDAEDGRNWPHTLWQIIIAGEVLTYKTGTGIKKAPTCAEVLACYCRDAIDADKSFPDWCGELGYDEDSRKAERIYFECQENGKKAIRVLKSRVRMRELADLFARL